MKTKQQINVLLLCLVCFLSACTHKRDCKNYTQCETAPIILEYFGNYKPGNYWIYENQDGTKRDSVWVSDYFESELKEPNQCFSYAVRKFVLHSQYLRSGKDCEASIDNGGNCYLSSFFVNESPQNEVYRMRAQSSDNTIAGAIKRINFNTHTNNLVVYSKGLQYPDTINSSNPDIKYYPISLFAYKIGLVQYSSVNLKDTFSLIKYYTK